MTEDQKYIYDSIFNMVRMGFDSKEDILEMSIEQVQDEGFEDEISEDWVEKVVISEFEKLELESKSWKSPTDVERLVKAFDELCGLKIIALHNAGYSTSDGEYDVCDIEIKLREKGLESDGYCFYHGQDLERAVNPLDRNLMIAFQKVDNEEDSVTLKIGKIVVEVLQKNGFEINWDETVKQKIEIINVNWQKLYDKNNSDFDHERVIYLMLR
jgi:hypothetical protein